MRKIVLTKHGLEDLIFWSKNDAKIIRKIFDLISDAQRNPFEGIGKPEALKYNLAGCWSRRIDDKNRLVYQVTEDEIKIISCRYHY
jgi:toxin YoeB